MFHILECVPKFLPQQTDLVKLNIEFYRVYSEVREGIEQVNANK